MFSTIGRAPVSVADRIARISALQGIARPTTSGPKPGIVFRERYPATTLNLRGSPDQDFLRRAQAALGCELPSAPNSSSITGDGEILRLAPNEWLLVAGAESRWPEPISIESATVTDVSHARVIVVASGHKVLDMLGKGCSVDLHPSQFPPGMCVQTGIAKISVILHRVESGEEYALYVPRSYAGSFWHWLTESAREFGFRFVRQ